jgi:hypothetical protein
MNPNTSALRNFSLPRERCLDTMPAAPARPLPIPPPYVAKGIISSGRPLPAIPNKANNEQSSLSQDKMIGEFIIQPLKIRKTSQSNTKPLLEVSHAEELTVYPTTDATSSLGPFSNLKDSESWPIATNCSSHEDSQEEEPETAESSDELKPMPVDAKPTLPAIPHPMESLTTPTIKIQQPTPTPSPAPESPKASITASSHSTTIRIVSSHLEVPKRIHHSSLRRKWAGQHGFISL